MRKKEPIHKVEIIDGKRQIIQQLLQEYDIESAEDIQEALKDLLGGTIKEMMAFDMLVHLGYEKSAQNSSFEPQVVKKRQKDISAIDQKIIAMYSKGMTTRQISAKRFTE